MSVSIIVVFILFFFNSAFVFLVLGTMHELAGGKRYNTAVFVAPDGRLIGSYRKRRPVGLSHEAGTNTYTPDRRLFLVCFLFFCWFVLVFFLYLFFFFVCSFTWLFINICFLFFVRRADRSVGH